MTKPLRTQFVIADSSRARWVERSANADDFVTVRELKAGARRHGHPQGVVFGSSGQRFNVEERHDAVREHRVEFAQDVADAINAQAAEGALGRLAVIAPSPMLSAISQRLSSGASAKLAKSLAKDLTKTPDHELGAWLRSLEIG